MNRFSLISLLALVPAAMLMTSCLDTDGEDYVETRLTYGSGQCFNVVTDLNSNESYVTLNPQYDAVINLVEKISTFSMSGIELTPGSSLSAFKILRVPVSTETPNYTYYIADTWLFPEGENNPYSFDELVMSFSARYIELPAGMVYAPVTNVRFVVRKDTGEKYKIVAVPVSSYVRGALVSQPLDDSLDADGDYDVPVTAYGFTLDPAKMTASVTMYNVQFRKNMIATSFKIEDIPFTVSGDGFEIKTAPGETYEIKDSMGKVIENCSVSWLRFATVLPTGTTSFSITADLKALQDNPVVQPFNASGTLSYLYSE